LEKYLKNRIDYNLDEKKQRAIDVFFKYLSML
jgi:predicted solute-binding protein